MVSSSTSVSAWGWPQPVACGHSYLFCSPERLPRVGLWVCPLATAASAFWNRIGGCSPLRWDSCLRMRSRCCSVLRLHLTPAGALVAAIHSPPPLPGLAWAPGPCFSRVRLPRMAIRPGQEFSAASSWLALHSERLDLWSHVPAHACRTGARVKG